MQPFVILLSPKDNVAVAVRDIPPGAEVTVEGATVVAADAIPLGHKMALRRIEPGQKILKFGVPVGSATALIEPGRHVHMHNVKSDYITNKAAL
jgi:hypothetical protein